MVRVRAGQMTRIFTSLAGRALARRWSLDILGGNPKGIVSLSPGLARFREGLPWVTSREY